MWKIPLYAALSADRRFYQAAVTRLRLMTAWRMAEGIREEESVSPDFDVAVRRHKLLDVIQNSSDTGIRQIL
jgi:hypothetical protein